MISRTSYLTYNTSRLRFRNLKINSNSAVLKHGGHPPSAFLKCRNVTLLMFNLNCPTLNKRYMSKLRLPGGKSKSKVVNNIKMFTTKYSRPIYAGLTLVSISTIIYLFGFKNMLLTVGGVLALPLMFVGRHVYIHFKSKSILFNDMKKSLTEKYRREIERHIGAFDVEKHNIKIHSREFVYDNQGRRLNTILGVINLTGSHGHAMCKAMIVKNEKTWEPTLLELEFYNYLTGQSGVDSILTPKESVNLTIDSSSHKVISEVKKNSLYNLPDNNIFNTPLIAMTKVSSFIMKRKGGSDTL